MNVNKRSYHFCIITVISFFIFFACSDDNVTSPPNEVPDSEYNWSEAADSSSSALIYNYWNGSENYFNYGNRGKTDFHYWPQAHSLDVMLDAYLRTGDPMYPEHIHLWYEGVPVKNGNTFLNPFLDDMEWNALAMLRAYHILDDEKFLDVVHLLWSDIITGWTDVAGGGIMWARHTPNFKAATSNAPASILSSRLYRLTDDETYLEWAERIYEWQRSTVVNTGTGAVYDGVTVENGQENVNTDWIFTYNQGTFIGSALELYGIHGERRYLDDAIRTADYTLNNLTDSNTQLLRDEGGGDGGLFKGIFVRYFTLLILEDDLPENTRNRYSRFLEHNAKNLWENGTNKNDILFDSFWNRMPGHNEEIDLTIQLSGAMLIEAAALLQNEDLIN